MSTVITPQLFGLLELDAAGTILYSRIEKDGSGAQENRASGNGISSAPTTSAMPDIKGRNFYSEVAPFQNVEEFHRRINSFQNSDQQAASFEFDCRYEDSTVIAVRVLLARLSERSDAQVKRSLLVHIRKAR